MSAVLRRQPLEQRVGVRRVTNRERSALDVLTDAVEDDDAAGATERDETRQRVHELARVVVRSAVQQVVAVEQIERRVSHA